MTSIQFLDSSNFSKAKDGSLLCSIPKYALVLFWSTNCPHCTQVKEIIQGMNNNMNGCTFGMCNLDENKECIDMIVSSGIEMSYVPFIVFFANQKPYMVYSGPPREDTMIKFIVEVSNAYREEVQSRKGTQRLTDGSTETRTPIKKIEQSCKIDDKQCIENARVDKGSCYLPMREAYANNRK